MTLSSPHSLRYQKAMQHIVDGSRNKPPRAEMDQENSLLNGRFSFKDQRTQSYLHLLPMNSVTTGVHPVHHQANN